MNRSDMIRLADARPEFRDKLYCRGFLVTDSKEVDPATYPFFGLWEVRQCGRYDIYAHTADSLHVYEEEGRSFFLIGHAYNPFTMEYREEEILKRIAESYGTDKYRELIDELTGIFVYGQTGAGGDIEFITDPSGMQSAFCGVVGGSFYLTSHAQLAADLLDLEMSDITKELVGYKWYMRVMGPYLPADLSPFDELRRIVPNNSYTYDGVRISHRRFWPLKDNPPALTDREYGEVIRSAADILKNNMRLVLQKWENPYISLTGGIDSNTTFAAANGMYDRFRTFSYVSADKEIGDAEAARKISEKFGASWTRFDIPESKEELEDYDELARILDHNNAYIAPRYDNETRKRVYLMRNLHADVEVKSWVSETIRAYWYKHYGRKTMPGLSPKLFRNLYKIFIADRALAHKVDRLFDCYIRDFEYEKIPACYPPADMHYAEVTWGSWGGLNISEMKTYADITIIYNNRKFLELMFRVPLGKRISDQHHLDMKKYLNPELYDMNVRVVNKRETKFRAFALNVIFTLNSILPF